ncbi:MAG: hypothetical protein Q8O67_11300 [Deltaproteobacteria bacterium]|nr:hypothetical protein [Deltaproteobacteria bacterium]
MECYDSRWPIVVIHLPSRRASTSAELDDNIARIVSFRSRGEPFAYIFDTRAAALPTAVQRRAIADAMLTSRQRHPGLLLASALVATPLWRGLFSALHWLAPPEHPTRAFLDVESAAAWASWLVRTAHAPWPR